MADSASETPLNAPTDKKPDFEKSPAPSPAQPLWLSDGSQELDVNRPSSRADSFSSISSIESSIPDNFAQTRSPLSMDQNEQATKYRYPSVEHVEDEEFGSHSSPLPRRISPFTTDFMTTTPRSSVFAKCKVTVPKKSSEATVDVAKSGSPLEEQPARSKQGNVILGGATQDSSPQSATNLGEFTKHEPAGEVSDVVQEVTAATAQLANLSAIAESLETNGYSVNTDLPEAENITDSTALPGILTILDEEIDRQFSGEALEPDSTDSSALTIIVTDTSGEPQLPWTPDLGEAHSESGDESMVKNDHSLLETPPAEVSDAEAKNKQQPEIHEEGLEQERASVAYRMQLAECTRDKHDQDYDSIEGTVASSESQFAYDTTSPLHIDELEHFGEAFTLNLPGPYLRHISEASLHDSVVHNSPHDLKQFTLRYPVQQLTPIERTFLGDFKESSPIPKEIRTNEARALKGTISNGRIRTEGGTTILLNNVRGQNLFTARQSPDSSIASGQSGTYQDSDSQDTSSELGEDITTTIAPGLQHMLIGHVLQDFKVDLLQQIESVIQENTKPLMPARNSAAATLLARSSPPQMETGIRASISNAQNEIMSAVEISKAEAVGCILHVAERNRAHSIEVANALQKTVVEHIDRRFEDLEKMLAAPKSERTVKFEAHPESNITDFIPPESLTALKQLPAVLEQAKAVAATNTQEVSNKLGQYAAKAEAVSSLCTRLDETLTSKQPFQNEIVSNLYDILNQSTLQNNAINDLAAVVNPLASLVKGVSYDTNLIDAKLAKNADVLASITGRTEALEKAAERFRETVVNAEHSFERAATKTDQAAKTVVSSNTTHVDRRFEAIQGQMLAMQSQLDQIAGALANHYSVSTRSTNIGSSPLPRGPTEQIVGSSGPASDATSTRADRPASPPASPTLLVTATFQVPNRYLITLNPRTLPLPTCTRPFKVIDILCDNWFASLQFHTLTPRITKFSFIAIWISPPNSTTRRVVDNDTAYQDWYDAVKSGRINGNGSTVCFEFIDSGERETEEPKNKKRKQDEMRRGSEDGSGLQISLDVWKLAKQTRFQGFE